jgi:two-component system cell cycle sensor histidine kinase/response regulator CckA
VLERSPSTSVGEEAVGEEESPESGRGPAPPHVAGILEGQSARDALLAETLRIARLGGFVWTPGGPPLWSDEVYRILGYEPGSVTPGTEAFFAAIHPDDLERVKEAWRRVSEGQLEDIEYRVVYQSTGEVRFVRGSGRIYRDGDQILQVVGALQDVTDSKRSAVALEEALAIARAAERVAGIGSFVVRVEAMEMVWTEGLKLLTGVEDPNADAATHLERVHPDDREKQRAWWDKLVREHSGEPLSVRMVRADGSIRHLYTQAAVMRLADGVERVVGTTIDVTERVQLEDQLRHAAKMEAIGTLAAGLAHDFNNYLLVMDSSLSMLAEGSEPDERDELIEGGRLALSRCMELTRQLLAFARREPFRPESVDLTEVVVKFQDLLNRAVGRRATLRIESVPGPLRARVDPRHVERMLTNLVVNAADAIEQLGIRSGRITVRLEPVRLAELQRAVPGDIPPGSYVCVVVDDNGGGIAPERLPRIFDPYFTTKPQGRGTGLGLASVYGMARQNDGLVSVSDLPHGTRFSLWFPLINALAEPAREAIAAAEALPVDQPDADILIVEDVDQVRYIAERILRSAGFRTLTASNGAEALELLERGSQVRLILTDLQMPIMGGRQLAEHVSRRPDPPPVIFMTGYSEDTHGQGANPHLTLLAKPFTPDRLIEFVKSVLG